MTMDMFPLMMIEVLLLTNVEILLMKTNQRKKMHQRNMVKEIKEKKDKRDQKDQLRRMIRRKNQSSKKNSPKSSVNKKISLSLKTISLMRKAMRKRKKPRQQMNDWLKLV